MAHIKHFNKHCVCLGLYIHTFQDVWNEFKFQIKVKIEEGKVHAYVAVHACVHTVAVVTRVPRRAAASVCSSPKLDSSSALVSLSFTPEPTDQKWKSDDLRLK